MSFKVTVQTAATSACEKSSIQVQASGLIDQQTYYITYAAITINFSDNFTTVPSTCTLGYAFTIPGVANDLYSATVDDLGKTLTFESNSLEL